MIIKSICRRVCVGLAVLAACVSGTKAQSLYVSGFDDNEITSISPGGVATTFYSGGPLHNPQSMAFDQQGNLFVANYTGNQIVKITASGSASVFATLSSVIKGVAFDSSGNLFVSNGDAISEITSAGSISTFATGGSLSDPQGIAFDASGNLFVTNGNNTQLLLKYNAAGVGTVFADHIGVTAALAFDRAGYLYASQFFTGDILKFATDGASTTFAGGLSFPNYLAFSDAGNLLVSVADNNIAQISSTGDVSTFSDQYSGGLAFAVPEPGTLALAGLGLAAMAYRLRRRQPEASV